MTLLANDWMSPVESDDVNRFAQLIASATPSEQDAIRAAALRVLPSAALSGRLAFLGALLRFFEQDPSRPDLSASRNTAFIVAAQAGQTDCALLLMEGHREEAPLLSSNALAHGMRFAVSQGKLDLVLALIPFCDTSLPCPWTGAPPAVSAALSGHPECFAALATLAPLPPPASLDPGYERDLLMLCANDELAHCLPAVLPYCDLQTRDKIGGSALGWAARLESASAVAFLLPFFDPREPERKPQGLSPLQRAERNKSSAIVNLMRARADQLNEREAIDEAALPASRQPFKPRL